MSLSTPTVGVRQTLADLAREPGKAELIGGRIVHLVGTGYRPNFIAVRILRSLADHVDILGQGSALMDNMGYAVPELSSGRESFSPDVSYFAGPCSMDNMSFLQGPPTFAVEVRSENDYGPAADRAIETKRADYFEAGTLVVWDVDPKADTIKVYRAESPNQPTLFVRGEIADAERAVPGWRVEVNWIFPR
jgi:Uma2 family endonuclease